MNCPHCGQRMLMRHDVQLSPKLADIFDAIEVGISDKKELATMFYGNGSLKAVRALVNNVHAINGAFAWMEVNVRIKSKGHNLPYHVVRNDP